MYLQKVISKKTILYVLKVIEMKIAGSGAGFVTKCHRSATLTESRLKNMFLL
jgi:hypothetical protein